MKTFRMFQFKRIMQELETCGESISRIQSTDMNWWALEVRYTLNDGVVTVTDISRNVSFKSSCHPDDAFKLSYGIRLATARLLKSISYVFISDAKRSIDKLNHSIEQSNRLIETLNKSYKLNKESRS